jgi:hypothetical protein
MIRPTGNSRRRCQHCREFVALPGDAIGFSGVDFVSDVINLFTWGWPRRGISHVAIVTECSKHGLCLAESTTLATRPCLILRRCVNGVQFQPLHQRIAEYRGHVWHYPLRAPIDWREAEEINEYLVELATTECAYDLIGAVRSRMTPYALIQRWKHGHEDLQTLFCSELVAATWNRFGIFPTKNASGWNPNTLLRAATRNGIVSSPFQVK